MKVLQKLNLYFWIYNKVNQIQIANILKINNKKKFIYLLFIKVKILIKYSFKIIQNNFYNNLESLNFKKEFKFILCLQKILKMYLLKVVINKKNIFLILTLKIFQFYMINKIKKIFCKLIQIGLHNNLSIKIIKINILLKIIVSKIYLKIVLMNKMEFLNLVCLQLIQKLLVKTIMKTIHNFLEILIQKKIFYQIYKMFDNNAKIKKIFKLIYIKIF